jgi:hypothetical protein
MDMNRAHDLPGLLHCFGLHPAVLDRLVLRSGAIYGVKSGAGAGGDGFLGIYEVYSNHQKVELSIFCKLTVVGSCFSIFLGVAIRIGR